MKEIMKKEENSWKNTCKFSEAGIKCDDQLFSINF